MKTFYPFAFSLLLSIVWGTTQAQSNTHEGVLDDMTLLVNALEINGVDKSNELSRVVVSNKRWKEYDSSGKEIGNAQILQNKHNEVQVKWSSATNGAKVDAITIYKIVKEAGSYTFHIYYDEEEHGHFNAVSE